MIAIWSQFLLSAVVVVAAGIVLARCADRIATLTGLGGLLIGSILLAGATSLPELMVGISATRQGMPDLAVGNLFGSSLCNLLILASADLLHRGGSHLFSRAALAHALAATLSVALTALAGLGILLEPHLHRDPGGRGIGGMSYGTLAVLAAYLLGLRLVFYDQRFSTGRESQPASLDVTSPAPATARPPWLKPLFGYLVAGAAILIAAPFLSDAAGAIADRSGLGKTFVGTSLVALCTSLPELVSTLAAVRLGAFDLALGNIFGSNAFNIAMLVPLDFASERPLLAQVSQVHVITCLATIVVTAVAVMGQLYQPQRRRPLLEPDALLVIVLVASALVAVYQLRGA